VLNKVKHIGSGYPGMRFGAPKTGLALLLQLTMFSYPLLS
jgi:hypothetical protein